MKPAPLAWLLLVLVLVPAQRGRAQEAIYIVRHAERADQSADSALSAQGLSRAERLRDMLRDAGVTQIFTSELRRTIATAAPLAAARHLTPQSVPAADAGALVARIAAAGPCKSELLRGQSNTISPLLAALYIVVPQKEGRPVLLRLKY